MIVAKSAGFCFGVKRAVDTVYRLSEGKHEPVYTLGPIIHNETVVAELAKRGVTVLTSPEELAKVTRGTIVIRSHGVSKEIDDRLHTMAEASGGALRIEDATCPFVKKIHKIVYERSRAGAKIILCGDEKHPEVQGITGWCEGLSLIHI